MRRVRNKKLKKRILIYILFILLFFLGNAYSLLKQDLKLSGTVTVQASQTSTIPLSAEVKNVTYYIRGYRLNFSVTNNTGADIDGWTAIISAPGITSLLDIILATDINEYCTIDTENETITVVMPVGSTYGTIANGETVTFLIGERGASSATIIDCYATQVLTSNYNSSAISQEESLVQNMSEVSIDEIEVTSLENVDYSNSDLEIEISFKENIENEKYTTVATIKIINKTNSKIENLSFELIYNDVNNYFSEITTTSLNQTLTHTKGSSYKLLDYDFIEKNSYKVYQISGFISDQRFTGFSISNVKYTFETNDNIQNGDMENNINMGEETVLEFEN